MSGEKEEKRGNDIQPEGGMRKSRGWIFWALGILVIVVIIFAVVQFNSGSGYMDGEDHQLKSSGSGDDVKVKVVVDEDI